MNKVNYQVYIMAMIELMINNNNQTDLGNYRLEYTSDFAEIGAGDMVCGDACLAVAVRLKNKTDDSIEWGNIYYKRLISNSDAVSSEAREKLEKMLSEINEKSEEEKLNFILNTENKVFKTPYAKSCFIIPELASFFQNLQQLLYDGYPAVSLGGKFPKEALPYLGSVFTDIIAKTQNLSSDKMKRYKKL
ncbi:hypothetical protein [Thomasclavelia cocleata]|uniref:hypothetical protein n=1 Tax=Thomasclavelia cocleata TaxID=69824 RepID=UPI002558193F|nr:hypothetical protein [Thomasclavelia cocleata]